MLHSFHRITNAVSGRGCPIRVRYIAFCADSVSCAYCENNVYFDFFPQRNSAHIRRFDRNGWGYGAEAGGGGGGGGGISEVRAPHYHRS